MVKKRGDGDNQPPIIKKVTSRRHKGHHGGAWKVAYADFVTSMMALFIVLWAAGQSPEIRSSIASYFRNPSMVPIGKADAGVLPASSGLVGDQAGQAPGAGADDAAEAEGQEALADVARRLRAALEGDAELKAVSDQVRIELTPEGLRIQLVERDDSLFFEIGSAQVKPAMTHLLTLVAKMIGSLPNDVVVEGHTDARQYANHRRGYSNWELSADRANSARRVLEGSGVRQRQVVRVVGFADHELLMPDTPLDAQNRRVSIIVRNAAAHRGTGAATATSGLDELKRAVGGGPQVRR
jgi:chemotaxis protein MotB